MLVQTHALTKCYRSILALEDCSLTVQPGEVFGLLGPNGSGKTTLLRLLLGMLRPTSGKATIGGLDCFHQSLKVRRSVAYLPGEPRLFRRMRGGQVLQLFADLRRESSLERSLQLAERLQLDLARRVAAMSTGMRQKLALAVTLAIDAPLLILDEPTSGLDPTMRAVVLQLIREAKAAGRTVLVSSHVLAEVEQVCDRVAILRHGRLAHVQAMSQLRQCHRIRAQLKGSLPPVPDALCGQMTITTDGDGQLTIQTDQPLPPVLSWLAGAPLDTVTIQPLGLQAVYEQFHGAASAVAADPEDEP